MNDIIYMGDYWDKTRTYEVAFFRQIAEQIIIPFPPLSSRDYPSITKHRNMVEKHTTPKKCFFEAFILAVSASLYTGLQENNIPISFLKTLGVFFVVLSTIFLLTWVKVIWKMKDYYKREKMLWRLFMYIFLIGVSFLVIGYYLQNNMFLDIGIIILFFALIVFCTWMGESEENRICEMTNRYKHCK